MLANAARLKEYGIPINLKYGIVGRPPDIGDLTAHDKAAQVKGRIITEYQSPAEDFERQARQALALPKAIAPKTPVDLTPFQMRWLPLPGGRVSLEIIDQLVGTKNQKPVATAQGNLAEWVRILDDLTPELQRQFNLRAGQHNRALATLPRTAPNEPVFTGLEGSRIPRDELRTLLRMSGSYKVELSAVPRGAESDATIVTLPLSKEILEKFHYAPIRVNGRIRSLRISRPLPADEQVAHGSFERGKELTDNDHIYYTRALRRGLVERVLDIVPSPGIKTIDSSQLITESPVRIDLSKVSDAYALLKLNGSILQATEKPVAKVGAYDLYADFDLKKLPFDAVARLQPFAQGASGMERLFGDTPGKSIKGIVLENAAQAGSSYRGELIHTSDEFLTEAPLVHLMGGYHEAAHRYDRKIGFTDRSQKFQMLFRLVGASQSDFFLKLRECAFLNLKPPAGHPHDDPSEFFASILTIAANENFTANLKRTISGMRKEESQLVLRQLWVAYSVISEELAEPNQVPATAPIHGLLKQRMTDTLQFIEQTWLERTFPRVFGFR